MSFCNTLKPDRTPGPISGNPLHNLCERACIQVRKVFDACINQTSLEDYGVTNHESDARKLYHPADLCVSRFDVVAGTNIQPYRYPSFRATTRTTRACRQR